MRFISKSLKVIFLLQIFYCLGVSYGMKPSMTNEKNTNEIKTNIIINKKGKLIGWCPYRANWVNTTQKIICTIDIKNGKVCLRNSKWDRISGWYDNISKYSEGLAAFRQDNLWGYLNTKGEVVIPAKFGGAGCFSSELARVTIFEKSDLGYYMMYIDKSGKIAFPMKFLNACNFKDGIARVKSFGNNDSGYINTKGKFLIKTNRFSKEKYEIRSCHDKIIEICNQEGKIGFANLRGDIIFKPKFDSYLNFFKDGVALVEYLKDLYLINSKGKIIRKVKYIKIYGFMEELAPAKLIKQESECCKSKFNIKHKKLYFIDYNYVRKFPLSFEDTQGFINGLAAVKINGKWGFVNKNGKIVIKPKYDKVKVGFHTQYALVIKNCRFINIDRQGNTILELPCGFYPNSPIIFGLQFLNLFPTQR